jgi:elongation factor P--beta-lysine ligase
MSDQLANDQSTAILKELSDIKSALAVNSNETTNIKQRVTELQVDVKEIKNDFINRREFTEQVQALKLEYDEKFKTLKETVELLWKIIYSIFGVIGLTVLGAIIKLVIK